MLLPCIWSQRPLCNKKWLVETSKKRLVETMMLLHQNHQSDQTKCQNHCMWCGNENDWGEQVLQLRFLCKRRSGSKGGNHHGVEVFWCNFLCFRYVPSGMFFMWFDAIWQYYNETNVGQGYNGPKTGNQGQGIEPGPTKRLCCTGWDSNPGPTKRSCGTGWDLNLDPLNRSYARPGVQTLGRLKRSFVRSCTRLLIQSCTWS